MLRLFAYFCNIDINFKTIPEFYTKGKQQTIIREQHFVHCSTDIYLEQAFLKNQDL